MSGLVAALGFLTRLPVGASDRDGLAWYGAAGALIGAAAGGVYLALALVLPAALAALGAVAATIALTGALHEDGLADFCDGLGARSRERALEVMRDSATGSFGMIGLGVVLAGRVMALAALGALAPAALIGAHAASRALMLPVMARGRYLRASGAGSALAGQVRGATLAGGGTGALLATLPLMLATPAGALAALAAATLAAALLARGFLRRLGGYTGDCLGAVQQVAELCFYLGLLAWL